jgi:hypothetical protein
MRTECADCDRQAVAYWGKDAYCSQCLLVAKREQPEAHRCMQCGRQQPANVSWWRVTPCGSCKAKAVPT